MCRVTMGHLRVTVGHLRVTIGHPRVIVFAFLFVSKLKANTTELHPKVRPTCFSPATFTTEELMVGGKSQIVVARSRQLAEQRSR